jgi:periplasmic protein TonB
MPNLFVRLSLGRDAVGLSTSSRIVSTRGRIVIALIAAIPLSLGLTACDKTERIPTTTERLKSVEGKQSTEPDFYKPRKTIDYMSDLKAIPADTVKAEPAPPKAERKADPRADAAKIEAIKAEAAKLDAARAESAKPTPVATVTPTPTPAPAPAPAPRVVEPTPAPAPTPVASAPPAATAARPTQEATPVVSVVAREQPEFPRDAIRQGIEGGTVRAQLTINAAGDVTKVAILQAQPPRIFDRAVTGSLSRWKFNPGAEGRTYTTEIAFTR